MQPVKDAFRTQELRMRAVRPLTGRVIGVIALLSVAVLFDLMLASSFATLSQNAEAGTSTGFDEFSELAALLPLMMVATLVNIGTGLLWLSTVLRAHGNIETLHPGALRWSREQLLWFFGAGIGASVLSIPIPQLQYLALAVNIVLWVPVGLVVHDLWRQGHPRRPGPFSMSIVLWCASGMVTQLVAGASWIGVVDTAGSAASTPTGVWRAVAGSYVLDIVFCAIAVVMVWRFARTHDAGLRSAPIPPPTDSGWQPRPSDGRSPHAS
ncbi:hypothetical protein GCM10027589_00730 [Actinocorallia lasiicapitis]